MAQKLTTAALPALPALPIVQLQSSIVYFSLFLCACFSICLSCLSLSRLFLGRGPKANILLLSSHSQAVFATSITWFRDISGSIQLEQTLLPHFLLREFLLKEFRPLCMKAAAGDSGLLTYG